MTYKICQVVRQGRHHALCGKPCQDQVYLCRKRGVVCAVLADGAGSRESSHIGAACVSKTVAELACEAFVRWWSLDDTALAAELIRRCLEALEQQTPPLYDLASTLLFFAADRYGRYITGHLGDGVQIQVTDGCAAVFSPPENGTFENETFLLTEEDALEHLRLHRGRLEGTGGFLMMSDGMGESLYQRSTGTPARACATMVHWLQEEKEDVIAEALAENTERLFAPRTADDLSLVVIAWKDRKRRNA